MVNNKVRESYEAIAAQTGLTLDGGSGALYGTYNGYSVLVYAANSSYPFRLSVQVAVRRAGAPVTKEECARLRKQNKAIAACQPTPGGLCAAVRTSPRQETLRTNVSTALYAVTEFLRAAGYENCCQTCGAPGATDGCCVGNALTLLCPACYEKTTQATGLAMQQKAQRKENVIAGVVGALGGALLGGACILLLSQLGYVAALSGIVMAVCTLKGYELLGGKLTKKGIIIGAVLMILATYFADRLDWAIIVARELDAALGLSYQAVPLLIQEGMIEAGDYYMNLGLVYLFVLLGAIPMVRGMLAARHNEGRVYRMGEQAAQPEMTEL